MPYRALLATFVTVGLALLAVGMWAAVVGPMLSATSAGASATQGGDVSALQLRVLTRAVLILAFMLIVTLLLIGLLATIRAWIRVKRPDRKRVRTRYVDAWKLAGERLEAEEGGEKNEHQ